jgi:hypothetical protein
MRLRPSQLRHPQAVIVARLVRSDLDRAFGLWHSDDFGRIRRKRGTMLISRHQSMRAPQFRGHVGKDCHAMSSAPPRRNFTARLDRGDLEAISLAVKNRAACRHPDDSDREPFQSTFSQ